MAYEYVNRTKICLICGKPIKVYNCEYCHNKVKDPEEITPFTITKDISNVV